MIDILRNKRNRDELAKTHPAFRHQFEAVLAAMAAVGRPRLQDTYRTDAKQLEFFKAGKSQVRSGGPHTNVMIFGGKIVPASLAIHVLDDDRPLAPTAGWIARLAVAAAANGLQTGCAWAQHPDSPLAKGKGLRVALEAAIAARDVSLVEQILEEETGFDPLHVEVPSWRTFIGKA